MPAAIAVTYRFDRLAGSFRPFRRHAITLSAYCQRRCAVARPIPNCQQIALPSLAHANLMAAALAAFEAIDAENEPSDVAEFIKRIAYVVDDLTVEDARVGKTAVRPSVGRGRFVDPFVDYSSGQQNNLSNFRMLLESIVRGAKVVAVRALGLWRG